MDSIEDPKYRLACQLVEEYKNEKFPYRSMEWFVRNVLKQNDVVWGAYFMAVNMMKEQGIPISRVKRKPLTDLTKSEAAAFRKSAKLFVKRFSDVLGIPVTVSKNPVKDNGDEAWVSCRIELSCHSWSGFPLTVGALKRFDAYSLDQQIILLRQFADRFKSRDRRLSENIEVVKADLEALLEK